MFQLPHDFVQRFRDVEPPFGFNGLGKVTYLRSYSRLKPDGTNERWFETVERVVNGTYTMMHAAAAANPGSVWSEAKAQRSAQAMYTKIFHMKFLPPGRGLYAMGTKITDNLKLYASLNNCAFVSTSSLHGEGAARCRPFEFLMLMSMMGVGVGFDTEGDGAFPVHAPARQTEDAVVRSRASTYLVDAGGTPDGDGGTATRVFDGTVVGSKPEDFTALAHLGAKVGIPIPEGPEERAVFVRKVVAERVEEAEVHVVEDSREGWVASTVALLDSYFHEGMTAVLFDYSEIRPKGTPLKTFGGFAPGPEPLQRLHTKLRGVLDAKAGEMLDTVLITDVMNLIGMCVVAGGVRRTAEIALGRKEDEAFVHLKDFGNGRDEWAWTSNNSVRVERMASETEAVRYFLPLTMRTAKNGEPGYFWLDNMQNYGRMLPCDPHCRKEPWATGTNPCAGMPPCAGGSSTVCPCAHDSASEQTLESYELCCLVETFPHRHDSLDEYLETLKYAYLYAKVVTTGMTQWPETNEIIRRNRRVGCSMTGVAQFVERWGRAELADRIVGSPKGYRDMVNGRLGDLVRRLGREVLVRWCETGYERVREWDATYSAWMGIPTSVKVTSIKPSGTVSLLGGATPGMHWPIERYYKRRIRIADTSPLLPTLEAAGFGVEKDVYAANTQVVTFPVYCGSDTLRTESEVPVRDQFELAALLQRHWADNQVSVTIKFWKDPTEDELNNHLTRLMTAYVGRRDALKALLGPAWAPYDAEKIASMVWRCVQPVSILGPKKTLLDRVLYCMEFQFSADMDEKTMRELAPDVLRLAKATELATLLYEFQDSLKAVSMLPMDTGVYAQAPYERITEEAYHAMLADIGEIDNSAVVAQPEQPIGCDGDKCTLAHSST